MAMYCTFCLMCNFKTRNFETRDFEIKDFKIKEKLPQKGGFFFENRESYRFISLYLPFLKFKNKNHDSTIYQFIQH